MRNLMILTIEQCAEARHSGTALRTYVAAQRAGQKLERRMHCIFCLRHADSIYLMEAYIGNRDRIEHVRC